MDHVTMQISFISIVMMKKKNKMNIEAVENAFKRNVNACFTTK